MANVLVGIVGVIVFIGLALAGASLFGPVMTQSMAESKASGVVQVLTTTAKAVTTRNRELETVTPAAGDASVVVPDYLQDVPSNPLNGAAVMLLTPNGASSGGKAREVVTKLDADATAMCSYLSQQGGGSASVQVAGSFPSRTIGCIKASAASSTFDKGDLLAYVTLN